LHLSIAELDIWIEGLHLRRRLLKTARNIIFGKTRNLAREYLTSAGTIGLVVHVGAHLGQEAEAYRGMGATRVNVQGHELGVLAGIGGYACAFDLCECEVSKEEIYKGGAL
jgi:hypothetical protein